MAPPSVTGGGILVSVGVLQVTGMESDQGDAMKHNDEFKPKCPGCKSDVSNFGAAKVLADRADKPITLLSCVDCGHVVGAFDENSYLKPFIDSKAVKAKSSCCGSEKLVAYLDRISSGIKNRPALILCGECERSVVASLPAKYVWKDI